MKQLYTIILTLLSGLFLSLPANAQNYLDVSFGTNGLVTSPAFLVKAMEVQNDGKIIVAGAANTDPYVKYFICRFNQDGTPDNTFGVSGKVQIGRQYNAIINDIKQLPNGQILAVGSHTHLNPLTSVYSATIELFRFNTTGMLDLSVGQQGFLNTGFGSTNSTAQKLVLLPDGKIYIIGQVPSMLSRAAIARYNANLTRDTSFNSNGYRVYNDIIPGFASVEVDAGEVITAISSVGGATTKLYRFLSNSNPDPTFGTNGVKEIAFGGTQNTINEIKRMEDGGILLSGTVKINNFSHAMLLKIDAEGNIDNGYGINGKVVLENSTTNIETIIGSIESNGKIVSAVRRSGNDFDYALLVTDFQGNISNNGLIATTMPGHQMPLSIKQQADGKILIMGDNASNMLLARYDISSYLSTGEYKLTNITAYPNPVKDILYINGIVGNPDLFLYDSLGKQYPVSQRQAGNGNAILQGFERLRTGIYFLNIVSGNDVKTIRILKQ